MNRVKNVLATPISSQMARKMKSQFVNYVKTGRAPLGLDQGQWGQAMVYARDTDAA